MGISSKEFTLLQKYIEEKCGITIGADKEYLLETRLSKLMVESGAKTFEEFYLMLYKNKDEKIIERMIDAITTNETLWFRDKYPWEILEKRLLPQYIEEIRQGKKMRVRIWSAAASTGQEAYSTAMSIVNYLEKNAITDVKPSHFEILGTDISGTVLQIAQLGRYDAISIMRGLDVSYKNKYFTNEGRVWMLSDKIKNMVKFQHFNLQESFLKLGNFDVVFCRYVLIYFSQAFKDEVLNKISRSLNKDGVLFIGSSEIFSNYQNDYNIEQEGSAVFYRVKR